MNKLENDRMPDELRRILQQGDPAAEGDLEPAEKGRLRRQILAAAEVPGRRWIPALRPLGYAVAGLAAVLAGWLALQNLPQRTGTLPPQPVDETPEMAQERSGRELPETVRKEQVPVVEIPVRIVSQQVEDPAETNAPPEAAALAVVPPPDPREPRQMQFVAGTTRVIWTLNPDFDLGPSKTTEQGGIS